MMEKVKKMQWSQFFRKIHYKSEHQETHLLSITYKENSFKVICAFPFRCPLLTRGPPFRRDINTASTPF